MAKVTIDKEGWRDIQLEDDFIVPDHVRNKDAYLLREKLSRYVNNNPFRFFRYMVEDKEFTLDCKTSHHWIEKIMKKNGASKEDLDYALDISSQLRFFYGVISGYSKRAYGSTTTAGGTLDSKAEELLDMFGRLYSVDEVHGIIVRDWGFNISRPVVQAFYTRNLKEIERLRDQYSVDFSDLSLTKKRSRLDRLSVMFYTYYNKWHHTASLETSRELRALLTQIKQEVEGEQLNINIQGQINVDLTIEVNKTLFDVYKRVPVNNLILAMVAAKKGIDPTRLMAQLTNSYYKNMTGYGKYEPEKAMVHPVDLTYNWNEIQMKNKGAGQVIEEAKIVTTTGDDVRDADLSTIKLKMLELLEKDKEQNNKRKSGKS